MFEQTFVHAGGAVRKPWSMAASLGLQLALTALVVVLPLFKTAEVMLKPPMTVMMFPRAERPLPPELRRTSQTVATAVKPLLDLRLMAPSHIPERVARVVDEVAGPLMPGNLLTGDSPSPGQFLEPAGHVMPLPPPPEKPVSIPAQKTLEVGGDVQQAMLVRQVMPVYPALARAARVSGKVLLAAVIAPDGTVQKLQLVAGPPLLVDAALKAVRQWVYKPTLLNGKPVEVITEITVNFTLAP